MQKIEIKATRLTVGNWTITKGAPEARWFSGEPYESEEERNRKFVTSDRLYFKNTGDTAVDFTGLEKASADYVGEYYSGFLQFEVRDLANNVLLRLPKPWPVGWTLEPGEERAFFGFFPWAHWDVTRFPNGDCRFIIGAAGGDELNIPTKLLDYDAIPIAEPLVELPNPTVIKAGFQKLEGLLGEVLKRLPPSP